MTTQEEFFQQHAVDGVLTEAQMAQMLTLPSSGGLEQGDSGTTPQGGQPEPTPAPTPAPSPAPAPAPTPAPTPSPAPAADGGSKEGKDGTDGNAKPEGGEPDPATLNRDNAVILAKDGKHTIGYEKLEEARERARAEAEARAAAERTAQELQRQIDALKAAAPAAAPGAAPAAAPAATAPAAAKPVIDLDKLREGVDFGDYSDEAVAKATAQMSAKAVELLVAPLQAELAALKGAAAQPPAAASAEDPAAAHYRAIYAAHPDADSIAESKELEAWLAGQPKVAANAYRTALKQGSTEDVIEVFSAFKAATGRTGTAAPAPAGQDAVAAAEAAIANAKPKPPTSLSEIPASTAAHHDEAQAMLDKSPEQALSMFEGKSPQEIEAILRRTL